MKAVPEVGFWPFSDLVQCPLLRRHWRI